MSSATTPFSAAWPRRRQAWCPRHPCRRQVTRPAWPRHSERARCPAWCPVHPVRRRGEPPRQYLHPEHCASRSGAACGTVRMGGSMSVHAPCSADLPVHQPEGEVAVPPAQEAGEARLDGAVPQGAQEGGLFGRLGGRREPLWSCGAGLRCATAMSLAGCSRWCRTWLCRIRTALRHIWQHEWPPDLSPLCGSWG